MKKFVIKISNKKDFINTFSSLSKQRLEILWMIKEKKPESIYELAQLLQKTQPYVQKEIKFLEKNGLIELKKSKINGRTRLKPTMEFQILAFEVEF